MDYKKIDDLLEKFWAGESSLEEEASLKELIFSMDEIPTKYQDIAAYFGAMTSEMAALELTDDFEEALLAKMEVSEKQEKKRSGFKGVFYLRYIGKVAAIVMVGLASFKVYESLYVVDPCHKETDPLACLDTFEDPEEAYRHMKAQLLQVSQMMNDGQGQLSRISKFDEAQQLLKNKDNQR